MTVKHLVFASSSSVYGSNKLFLFSEHHSTDHPLSFYAATKKANEAMAHAYSYAYGLPVTGLRFFSVYGPWGRPDMAPFIFTEAILHGKTIQLFNRGEMQRDFTYIDDVTEVVARVLLRVPKSDHGWHSFHATSSSIATPYRLLNVGNGQSVSIAQLVLIIEEIVGRKAKVVMAPMQKGDLPYTCANIEELLRVVDFAPSTPLAAGIARFVAWYRNFHH
jgi:UDP-glucuronate 4-epimerase